MFKRLIVLLLALLISVCVIACTKKVDTETGSSAADVSSNDTSSVHSGKPGANFDDAEDMTSSEFEKIESETMNPSNIEITDISSEEASSETSSSVTSSEVTSSDTSSEVVSSRPGMTNFH